MAQRIPLDRWSPDGTAQLPDFIAILDSCTHTVPSMDDPDPVATIRATEKVCAVIESSKEFLPALIEIGVVQDQRLWSERGRGNGACYFVSHVVSNCNPVGSTVFRDAWDAAITSLGNEKIISHPDTYASAYLFEHFAWIVDRARSDWKQWTHPVGNSEWPRTIARIRRQQAPLSASGFGMGIDISAKPSNVAVPIDTDNPPVTYKRRYPFDPKEPETPVEDLVALLATQFLCGAIQRLSHSPPHVELLLRTLQDCLLLIVPFRRPGQSSQKSANSTPADYECRLAGPDSPGGCVFTILKRLPATVQTSPKVTNALDRLDDLALRLSWMLQRATLWEAHTELDVRTRETTMGAAFAHVFFSDLMAAHLRVDRIRFALKDGQLEKAATPLIQLKHGIKRLISIAEFARDAYKVLENHIPPLPLSQCVTAAEFIVKLRQRLDECWSELVEVSVSDPERLPLRALPPLSNIRDWTPTTLIQYHDAYLSATLTEVLKNLKYADTTRINSLMLSVEPLPTEATVCLRISNAVAAGKRQDSLEAAITQHRKRAGLSTLFNAAQACNLPPPEFNFRRDSSEFTILVRIGRFLEKKSNQ